MAGLNINAVVSNVIAQNPNVSKDQLRVLVRENLDKMKFEGVKVSPKQMNKANALVNQIVAEQTQVEFKTRNATPKTNAAVKKLNAKKAASTKQQRVAASATKKGVVLKDAQKFLDYVEQTCTGKGNLIFEQPLANKSARASMEVFTGVKAKNFGLLEGMIDEQHNGAATFEQHLENLKAEGKIAEHDAALAEMHNVDTTPHETSKKRKQKKKAAEAQSRAEHKANRPVLSKDQRDAKYCTENGIVRNKNRKYLDYVKKNCTGEGNLIPETRLPKSAEESFRIFEQAGKIPAAEKKAVETIVETGTKAGEAVVEAGSKSVSKLAKFGKVGMVLAAIAGVGYVASELLNGAKDKAEENKEFKLSA